MGNDEGRISNEDSAGLRAAPKAGQMPRPLQQKPQPQPDLNGEVYKESLSQAARSASAYCSPPPRTHSSLTTENQATIARKSKITAPHPSVPSALSDPAACCRFWRWTLSECGCRKADRDE